MVDLVSRYKSSKETLYNVTLCVLGGSIWTGLFLGFLLSKSFTLGMIAFLPYVALFAIFFIFSAIMFRANAMGNMILVSKEQFPHIHQMIVEGAQNLRMHEPEAFIYNSNGLINAFARQVFGKNICYLRQQLSM